DHVHQPLHRRRLHPGLRQLRRLRRRLRRRKLQPGLRRDPERMPRHMTRRRDSVVSMRASSVLLAGALGLAIAVREGGARADDPEAARAAYDRGKAAAEAKRWLEAANAFARADALAPNDVALASALKVAALADDPALALTLADRAEQRAGAREELLAAARKLR